MQVYMFRAALLCKDCGEKRCLNTPKPAGMDINNEYTWDSDDYPKGPYSNGGGEADSPQHCDDCGTFLENELTSEGDKYVRELAEPYNSPDASWNEVADAAEQAGKPILAEWIRFYFGYGS